MSVYAALYLRLSRDDGSAESESISSQRMLLTQYAETHGIIVSAEFIDDGVSGSRWERDGFQQLLQAVEDGWISTVLVKDLSRLSRDYIRTGELLERWFPQHGARLIAVNDGVDTGDPSAANDYSAIRAVMDDWYARDISHKVRAAIYARQRAGLCTAASLPYGYIRTGGEIEVSEPAASHVRQIFSLYLRGCSASAAAKQMTAAQIPAPGGLSAAWSDTTVRRILKNTAYIGRLRLHTTERRSYKCSRRIELPEECVLWYPVPRVVSDADFEDAQHYLHMRRHRKPAPHWLCGKVTCGICGANMLLSQEKSGLRLICGTRKRSGQCDNPSMPAEMLLSGIRAQLSDVGVHLPDAAYPLLISHITVDAAEAHVNLRYQLP